MNASYWLDRATAKIHFAPDRSAVRRELDDHIRDRQEGYLAQGLEMYEAEQRAVADMGDPNAIADGWTGEVPDWVEIPIGCGGCLRVNLAKGVVTE